MEGRARRPARPSAALDRLREAAKTDENLMAATLECARAGVTTGEWAGALREVFGEYRAPTGVTGVVGVAEAGAELTAVRERVRKTGEELGGRLRMLVGKPGLDGHSNGAEQIAVRARDAGFEVVYQGIRLTPAQIVAAAVEEDVHCVGLSILSGSHLELVPEVLRLLAEAGLADVPVVVGGIIPEADAAAARGPGGRRGLHPQGLRHHRGDGPGGRRHPRRARPGVAAARAQPSPRRCHRKNTRASTSPSTTQMLRTSAMRGSSHAPATSRTCALSGRNT